MVNIIAEVLKVSTLFVLLSVRLKEFRWNPFIDDLCITGKHRRVFVVASIFIDNVVLVKTGRCQAAVTWNEKDMRANGKFLSMGKQGRARLAANQRHFLRRFVAFQIGSPLYGARGPLLLLFRRRRSTDRWWWWWHGQVFGQGQGARIQQDAIRIAANHRGHDTTRDGTFFAGSGRPTPQLLTIVEGILSRMEFHLMRLYSEG